MTKLFEGKNINWKMTLRKELKNVKIQNAETMQSYFTRVSQRTTWSSRRISREYISFDNHLEWPPRIKGFIHSRNAFQKEVITLVDSRKSAHKTKLSS